VPAGFNPSGGVSQTADAAKTLDPGSERANHWGLEKPLEPASGRIQVHSRVHRPRCGLGGGAREIEVGCSAALRAQLQSGNSDHLLFNGWQTGRNRPPNRAVRCATPRTAVRLGRGVPPGAVRETTREISQPSVLPRGSRIRGWPRFSRGHPGRPPGSSNATAARAACVTRWSEQAPVGPPVPAEREDARQPGGSPPLHRRR